MKESGGKGAGVDLNEVSKLLHELERDLEKLKQGSGDVDALRDEVQALGLALKTSEPDATRINRGLKNIHAVVAAIEEDILIVADYAARIGRMLGM
jgi:hypothetical protein